MRCLIFCAVQCLLAVTWTLYTAFLPQLAAQVGISKAQVAWILLMDQAIFAIADSAMGIAADRMANAMHRLGVWILAISVVSGVAFVLLPAATSPALLVGLTALWAATSSALRAPPMVIIARRLEHSAAPLLIAWSILGIGLAGALAPMLTAALRQSSPVVPFLLASAGLVVAVVALRWIELPPREAPSPRRTPHAPMPALWLFFAATWLLAFGFQIHTAINSGAAYLRYAPATELVRYMPAFWVGFVSGVLLPQTPVLKRVPAAVLLLASALLGAFTLIGFATATTLSGVLLAQGVAGVLWAMVFGTVVNAATDAGHVGREGRFVGLVFALAALAALTRIAMLAAGATAPLASWLPWLPVFAWGGAAVLLAAFAWQGGTRMVPPVSAASPPERR